MTERKLTPIRKQSPVYGGMPPTLPAAHYGHAVHPHTHVVMADGRRKPCSGQYWCAGCATWFGGAPCQ